MKRVKRRWNEEIGEIMQRSFLQTQCYHQKQQLWLCALPTWPPPGLAPGPWSRGASFDAAALSLEPLQDQQAARPGQGGFLREASDERAMTSSHLAREGPDVPRQAMGEEAWDGGRPIPPPRIPWARFPTSAASNTGPMA
ncbi:hypothetical protein AAFF_G00268450 [Aldrovandia affinis]|uniref:Uncharacterized protein n=1 Tax=Aldrovandia affinis TaxID=143900 RepID=A0AAD7WSH6_9TELE|nr:hypothetical protein AAFF_G00268450 [Aldrovandia affinis]